MKLLQTPSKYDRKRKKSKGNIHIDNFRNEKNYKYRKQIIL